MAKTNEETDLTVAAEIKASAGWWLSNMGTLPHRVSAIEKYVGIRKNLAKTIRYVAQYYTPEEKKAYLIDVCQGNVKPGSSLGAPELTDFERIVADNLPVYLRTMGARAFTIVALSGKDMYCLGLAVPEMFKAYNFFNFEVKSRYEYLDKVIIYGGDKHAAAAKRNRKEMLEAFAPEFDLLVRTINESTDENMVQNVGEVFKTLASMGAIHS